MVMAENTDFSDLSDHDLLVKLATTQQTHSGQLKTIFHSIEGNGQKGLKERVTLLEAVKVNWINVGMFAVALAGVLIAWFR